MEETTAGGHGEGVGGGVVVGVADGGIDEGQACDRGSNKHDGGPTPKLKQPPTRLPYLQAHRFGIAAPGRRLGIHLTREVVVLLDW